MHLRSQIKKKKKKIQVQYFFKKLATYAKIEGGTTLKTQMGIPISFFKIAMWFLKKCICLPL